MVSYPEMQKFFSKELPKLLERIESLEKKVENLEHENKKLQWELQLK